MKPVERFGIWVWVFGDDSVGQEHFFNEAVRYPFALKAVGNRFNLLFKEGGFDIIRAL